MPIDRVLSKLDDVQGSGPTYKALCPAHDDSRHSLSVKEARDGRVLIKCHRGCDTQAVVEAMGLTMADFFPDATQKRERPRSRIVETYDYTDEAGLRLFQAVRFDPKDFKQRHYDPAHPKAKRDGWVWSLKGVRRVLYRLPRVLEAAGAGKVVFVVEGEKDVDALERLGLVATCNPMGAGKWLAEYAEYLRGAHAVVIPDNDKAGRHHVAEVARSLHGKARSVRVVELPGLPERGDVSDWLAAGGILDELKALSEETPRYEPPARGDGHRAPPDEAGLEEDKRPSTLELLLELASPCTFFQGHDGEAYVSFPNERGGVITSAVQSNLFSRWLRHQYFRHIRDLAEKKRQSAAPNQEALQAALNTLEAQAIFEPQIPGKVPVYLRAGGCYDADGTLTAIYIDLANEAGEVVEITPGTWQIITIPPVQMLRTAAQHRLPQPDPAGRLSDVLPLLRTESPGEAVFILAWLVYAFHPDGPYPVLVLHGTAGSGKSSLSKFIRSIIDPVQSPVRRPPKSSEDLFIWARHNRVVSLENISQVSDRLSDDLCSIATGAGVGGRTLYTNADESSFTVRRPILINGIDEFVTRGDLASRTLKVNVPTMPRSQRETETRLRKMEDELRPRILGGICHALAEALKHPHHQAAELPRMADFANFIDAAEILFPEGMPRLIDAMAELHDSLAHELVASSGVASAICAALALEPEGTLRGDVWTWWKSLARHRGEGTTWPGSVQAFRSALRRVTPALEQVGIELCPDGQDPLSRRAVYVASLKTEHDPSDPSDPSGPAENGAARGRKGDIVPKDARRIGEESKDAAKDSAGDPSTRNGHFEAVRADSEGSKDPKDESATNGVLACGTVVRHRRERWEGTVTALRDGAAVGVWPFGASSSKLIPVADLDELF